MVVKPKWGKKRRVLDWNCKGIKVIGSWILPIYNDPDLEEYDRHKRPTETKSTNPTTGDSEKGMAKGGKADRD